MANYLLDTNHCSRVLENDPAVLQRLAALGNATVATCAIVRGELIFMAEFSQQRAVNLHRVEALLSSITVYPVDEEVADWYGSLKARLLDRFGPKAKTKRRKTTLIGSVRRRAVIASGCPPSPARHPRTMRASGWPTQPCC